MEGQEHILANGLSTREAAERLEKYGKNTLQPARKESLLKEFLEELREPMVLLLLITGVLYVLWGETAEALTIFAVILALNTVEVLNEKRAKDAIASLTRLAEPTALVSRDGTVIELAVELIVPGDLLHLEAGRRVPADAVLIEAYSLSLDESALSGESFPVEKKALSASPSMPSSPPAENRVYASSMVTRGRGKAIVTATAMQSEIGNIAGMTQEVKEPRTPLQLAMDRLSRWLVWAAIGFSLVIPLLGITIAHQPARQMLLTGLSLAFATIPEELPIMITMVLALGAHRLSKKQAIVKRLKAIESLGAVTVIATDKTGTLTENRLNVVHIEPQQDTDKLLSMGILCNSHNGSAGDPLDAALLHAAHQHGLAPAYVRHKNALVQEFPFDNERKLMSTIQRGNGHLWVILKGAPESVLAKCTRRADGEMLVKIDTAARQTILSQVAGMADCGLRVIALAGKQISPQSSLQQEEIESQLIYNGLVGLADIPRPEAAQAISTCRQAGIRTLMISGDHPATALSIARQVGLDENPILLTGPELDRLSESELAQHLQYTSIFARTSAAHKLRIVKALQASGARVAVTGDGVNDAPALAAADIGFAMGKSGSDTAREAADIILTDDRFTTIVNAIMEGRLLFENLTKGVRYYLACKLALVFINLLPALLGIPLPFAPLQIIIMELFMDLAAAAAFVAEPAETDLLNQPPRNPKHSFIDGSFLLYLLTAAAGLFAAVSAVYLLAWYGTTDLTMARSSAFFCWLAGHVMLAFNMRTERRPVLLHGLAGNRLMNLWAAGTALFLLLASVLPALQQTLKVAQLSQSGWTGILLAAAAGTCWAEVFRWIRLGRLKSGVNNYRDSL